MNSKWMMMRTPDEIHDEAKDIFFNYCNYSYHEIKDEEEEQNG
ncbi:putative prophage protein [Escherichia coli]|uniref:Putative prophage protein n=1 Tax=Escherichia coli TaxID=562 RepID=A0A376LMG0_ECOLX|nr:putative prophage protein [Escherichia coli]